MGYQSYILFKMGCQTFILFKKGCQSFILFKMGMSNVHFIQDGVSIVHFIQDGVSIVHFIRERVIFFSIIAEGSILVLTVMPPRQDKAALVLQCKGHGLRFDGTVVELRDRIKEHDDQVAADAAEAADLLSSPSSSSDSTTDSSSEGEGDFEDRMKNHLASTKARLSIPARPPVQNE